MILLKNFANLFCKDIQNGSEEKMKGSNFIRDSVDLLYYHLHKTSLRRGGSYIKPPEWLKIKEQQQKRYIVAVASAV